MSKITIIGGSGFVGTNLCRQLAQKQKQFEILDINQSREFPEKCKIADVRDFDSLCENITGDIVINLAAVHRDNVRDKTEYWKTNVTGAENVARACESLGIKKIIFTSSVAVYGFAEPGTDEHGKINPFNDYGKTKYEAEEKLRKWQSIGDRKLIIIRPTVIFGEGNRGNVYNLINQIASNKFMMIGKGENVKSIAYIGNIVAFIEKTIDSSIDYGIYNYVDTPNLKMNDLVSEIRKFLGKNKGRNLRMPYLIALVLGYIADGIATLTKRDLLLSSIRVKKFVASTEFRSDKNSLDGFEAPFTLEEALNRTIKSEFLEKNSTHQIFYTE